MYAAAWAVGGVALSLLQARYEATHPEPTSPSIEMPAGKPAVNPEPMSEQVLAEWSAAKYSNDLSILYNFAKKYPETGLAHEAWQQINRLINAGQLKIASSDQSLEIIADLLKQVQKEKSGVVANALDSVASSYNLESRFPLGFGIFYSDGHKIVSYGHTNKQGIEFDTSNFDVIPLDNKGIIIQSLVITRNGKPYFTMKNDVFMGFGPTPLLRMGNVILEMVPLVVSSHGWAWVIGLRSL